MAGMPLATDVVTASVLDVVGALVVVLDTDGRIVLFNRECEQVTGYSFEEVRNKRFWDIFLAPEDKEPVRRVFDDLRAGFFPNQFTNHWLTKRGERRLIQWSNTAITAPDGRVEYVIGTGIDATERVRAERMLRLVSSAVEFNPSSIVITDAAGRIEYVNPAFTRSSGFTAAEAIGMTPRIMRSGLMPQQVYDDLWRTIAAGESWRGELCNMKKNGEILWEWVAIAPLRDGEGRITHYVGIQHDITEQREMQQRVRDLQDQLVRISRLNELGQMVSALAHEVNQPLAAVMNYVQASRRLIDGADVPVPAKASALLVKAGKQVERVGSIIRRLREFTEKGEGKRVLQNINHVVEEASGLGLVGAADLGILATLTLAVHLPPVLIDRVRIQQVLFNLIRNAIEAMADSPERVLHIKTAAVDDDTIEVTIEDTGPGLPAAVVDRLFEPFVTTKPHGIGIGLSISHAIVEAHGGRLSTAPRIGGGTVFRFTLPAAGQADGDRRNDGPV